MISFSDMPKSHLFFVPNDLYFTSIYTEIINQLLATRPNDLIIISPVYGISYDTSNFFKFSTFFRSIKLLIFKYKIYLQLQSQLASNFQFHGLDLSHDNIKIFSPFDWFSSRRYININLDHEFLKFKTQLANYSQHGIPTGDLIIDTFLRFKPSPSFSCDDKFSFQCLKRSWQYYYFLDFIESNYNVCSVHICYSTYVYHGLPCRYFSSRDIPTYTYGSSSLFFIRHSSSFMPCHQCECNYTDFSSLPTSLKESYYLKSYQSFTNRLNGLFDVTTSYINVSSSNSFHSYNLLGNRVLFLHDFFDSPHIYHSMLFTDFYNWIIHTIELAISNQFQLFIKPHPNQSSDSAIVVSDLKKRYLNNPYIHWLPTQLTNASIFKSKPSVAISVYGSVLAEAAFIGINNLSAGNHPGVQFGFSFNPVSISEYDSYIIDPFLYSETISQDAVEFLAAHSFHISSETTQSLLRYHACSLHTLLTDKKFLLTSNSSKSHLKSSVSKLITSFS
jgi:hypothetical protein